MSKKILIIGEHSYIGNSFKQYIEENKENTSLVQVETVGAKNGAWMKKDFSQYDVILHVAAIVHQKESKDKKQLYIDINAKLPVFIAKKAKRAGVGQFIFLSTMAVYGEVEGAITDSTPLKPVTMYGKSKLLAERKLQELDSKQFKVVIVRPPMVYGKNCPGNYQKLRKLANYCPVFPDVENKRSMIEITNLCECIWLLIEREEKGLICPRDSEPICTTKMYIKLRQEIGKKTWKSKKLGQIIKKYTRKSKVLNKMFESYYYQ